MNCTKIHVDKNFNIIVDEEYNQDFAYVYILQHTKSNGDTDSQTLIKDTNKKISFETISDGYYVLITLKVPKDETNYYYYKDEKFYRLEQEVSIEQIFETNPELSNITPVIDYYFLTARLKKCFIDISKEIFNTSRCFKNGDSELIYRRDLVWSALGVLEFLIESDQYEEAQRLLEELTECNGLCQPTETHHCNCRNEN